VISRQPANSCQPSALALKVTVVGATRSISTTVHKTETTLLDPSVAHIVRFGVFELDLRTGELRKSGVRLNLPDQPSRS